MPIRCTFELNKKETSRLICHGYGTVEAFSGQKQGRDNPAAMAMPEVGPIPRGTYYLVDRQSGGLFGGLRDELSPMFGSTDRRKWFALWNPRTGDFTNIDGVRRGQFRLHPEGRQALSEGCITVVNPAEFELLQRFIRRTRPSLPLPGTVMTAYGTVEVR